MSNLSIEARKADEDNRFTLVLLCDGDTLCMCSIASKLSMQALEYEANAHLTLLVVQAGCLPGTMLLNKIREALHPE